MRRWQSGQLHKAVNLADLSYVGSNPTRRTMSNNIGNAWKQYNLASNQLQSYLGRTSNIVGEYSEYLIKRYLGGELLPASNKSADVEFDGTFYQVKARRLMSGFCTQLGIIRSWEFDYLAVILFDNNGTIKKALLCNVEVVREYAKSNKYQNGLVVSTTNKFLNDSRNNDITSEISKLNK